MAQKNQTCIRGDNWVDMAQYAKNSTAVAIGGAIRYSQRRPAGISQLSRTGSSVFSLGVFSISASSQAVT